MQRDCGGGAFGPSERSLVLVLTEKLGLSLGPEAVPSVFVAIDLHLDLG